MLHIAVDVRGIECKPGDRVIVPINPLHVKGMKDPVPVTAMQWDPQAVRAALAAPGEKTSRRLLSELCEDFRREKPEEWKRI